MPGHDARDAAAPGADAPGTDAPGAAAPGADTPEFLRSNAWCGEPAQGAVDEKQLAWGVQTRFPVPERFLAPVEIDLDDWTDPRVGWGVVLPDRKGPSDADKAAGNDAPEPIRALLAARRGAVVLRYRTDVQDGRLRRYRQDGPASDLGLNGARGTGPNAVPRYLLIVGSPADIPWSVQYRLQTSAYVGRLDLEPEGLARYVEALLGNWAGASRNVSQPVVWSVDHGYPDITRVMRMTMAERLAAAFRADDEFDMRRGFLSDECATHADLARALHERSPAFVATTSHGATRPLDNAAAMRRDLGLPVDVAQTVGDIGLLLDAWKNPSGAIWYAHACCSAGADAASVFEGVVEADSTLGHTLSGIAKVGACTAPLPKALLGGTKPLGAFIGHVEPTFDWTLRDPANGQVVTQHVIDTLYRELHAARRPTVGRALSRYFDAVPGLLMDHLNALAAIQRHEPSALTRARRARLVAMDRLSMVLLGDPTVRLPLPR